MRPPLFWLSRVSLAGWMLFCSHGIVRAQEWTRFRGPNGTGVSRTEFPAQWSKDNFAWQIELPGVGHSSPVVWGEKLFLMSSDPNTAERYVLCLSTETGGTIWKKSYASQPHHLHNKSSYASVTPAVDATQLFTAWSTPEHTFVVAFDHEGHEQWKTDIGGWIGQHGYGTSPVIFDDLVVITNSQEPEKRADGQTPKDCFVIALDRKTGGVRWKTPRKIDTASYSVPCERPNAAGERELVFLSTAEGIFALDPKTGRETWSSGPVFTMRTVSSPLLWNDLVFGTTGSGGGGNYVVAFRPGDAQPRYEIKKEMPYVPTPVIHNDILFLWSDKGIVTCVNPADGTPYWQKRVGGNYSGSPIVAGTKLFCIDEAGTVVVLAAGKEFQNFGSNALNEKSHSTPAVSGNKMFVRTISHLHAIRAE